MKILMYVDSKNKSISKDKKIKEKDISNKRINKEYTCMLGIIVIAMISLSVILVTNLLEERNETYVDVNATPIVNKTIIIDSGHRTSRSRCYS